MELPDLKQLDRLIALCRKRGVETVKIGELELTLSERTPVKPKKASDGQAAQADADDWEKLLEDLPYEQKLAWSALPLGPANEDESEGEK